MKKIIILSIILILGLSLVAYTASMKLDLIDPNNFDEVKGFVIVNYTPKDAANEDSVNDTIATIQIQVRDLEANTVYIVKSLGWPLGSFTTDKHGKASWHCNVDGNELFEFDEAAQRRINIRLESNNARILWTGLVLF